MAAFGQFASRSNKQWSCIYYNAEKSVANDIIPLIETNSDDAFDKNNKKTKLKIYSESY